MTALRGIRNCPDNEVGGDTIVKRATIKLLTNVETSVWIPASQFVPMAPALEGTGNPKKLNHKRS